MPDTTINWFDQGIRQNITKAHGSTNCPNCGAPIDTERCPYCGSLFVDFACMDADKPFFMKIKRGDNIHIVKVALQTTSWHRDDPVSLYSDCECIYKACTSLPEITMNFIMVP